ncbi:MAG: glutamate-5-semialdehyde dehydrogenase [Prevotellaceae bacterium]|jgi:glutamate-5-semialdehyde dehydrogenase|nr:glutamate-5-semialdehyde dehydrogenase [Prevotellaceae bacterium]
MLTEQLIAARRASRRLTALPDSRINDLLRAVASAIVAQADDILHANTLDLARMNPENPSYDRLLLTLPRLQAIAGDMRHVATLPSPLGRTLFQTIRPNGMRLRKVSVPFGVIGVIYEARPNVGFDVFALCLKSGSACVLKGGSDADESNRAIVQLIHRVLQQEGLPPEVVTLLPSDREVTAQLLQADGYVDVLIPRGGSGLISYVRRHATVPVIETGAGVCHTYFDRTGQVDKGTAIVCNAKTRRVSVCNALDCLLVDRVVLALLPRLSHPLAQAEVRIYADEESYRSLENSYPSHLLCHATPESYGTEYLSYAMSVKCVADVHEAIEHIHRYGSGHSECIVAESEDAVRLFQREVDAACVYANVSTAFTDGAQFGLGAEIGISTQKLHARGPMGLEEITTYKWLIEGEGQVRAK